MREVGPVRIQFFGDKAAAQSRIGRARVELGELKQQMLLGGLDQHVRTTVLADGTVIVCASAFGQDEISITVPRRERGVTIPEPEFALNEPVLMYAVAGADGRNGAVGGIFDVSGHKFTVAIAGEKLVVIGERDLMTETIKYAQRAVGRGDDGIAAAVLNYFENPSGGGIDAVLACDEGFFVDPSRAIDPVYGEKLAEGFADFVYAFAHVSDPSAESYDLPAEYNRLSHGTQPTRYGDAFFVFDGPPENPKRTLWNTSLQNAGSALINTNATSFPANPILSPEFPGIDNLAVGTAITHEQMSRDQATTTATTATQFEFLYVRKQLVRRNYYTAVINTPGTFMQAALFNGTTGITPTDGEYTVTVVHQKYRRAPSGWLLLANESLAPDAIGMVFTKDGNEPATDILLPASGVTLTSRWSVEGSMPAYAEAAYGAGEITYGNRPRGAASIFPTAPTGTGATYLSSTSAVIKSFYPSRVPAAVPSDVPADPPRLRYTSPSGRLMELSVSNALHLRDSAGVDLAVTPAVSIALKSQAEGITGEWVFADRPTGAQFYSDARVTIRLQLYRPNGFALRAAAPPAAAFTVVVYHRVAEKIIYATVNDRTFFGSINFSHACAVYLRALGSDPSAAGPLLEDVLSRVTITHNDGLPPEFIALGGSPGIAAVIG
jgi:hypothetical protein